MCGVIGYAGKRPAKPILLQALERLEYRGYDSCGVALQGDKHLRVFKNVGRVGALAKTLPEDNSVIGIGHTRWSTHGEPSHANAHPHMSFDARIAVVHNGIITNFHELREQLTRDGYVFRSETDTEVIPHLIAKYYDGNLAKAVAEATGRMEGTFAILVLKEGDPVLVGARRESPLIVGLGDNENFIASDVPAFLSYTNRAVYLEEDDLVMLSADGVNIVNSGRSVTRNYHIISWDIGEAEKAGYEHFMLKEIHEQPRVIDNTLAGHISSLTADINLGVDIGQAKEVLFLACGSSRYAGMIGEYLFSRLCRLPVSTRIASEFDDSPPGSDGSLAVGISQSGETADTIKALRRAKDAGWKTLAVTNVTGSTITRNADRIFYFHAGPEISVAATKSFIAQLICMYLLGIHFHSDDQAGARDLAEDLRAISTKVRMVLQTEGRIAQLAARFAQYNNAFTIARGISYPVALEGALKLKEIAYVHSEAYAAGEIKHGPFALLRSNTPVIAIVPLDSTYEPMLTSIKEIKARGAPVIAIASEKDEKIEQYVDDVLRVPEVAPLLSPVVNTVVIQLLAYYTARERECPIDLPANLAKTITVP